jgi:hypothetical protein
MICRTAVRSGSACVVFLLAMGALSIGVGGGATASAVTPAPARFSGVEQDGHAIQGVASDAVAASHATTADAESGFLSVFQEASTATLGISIDGAVPMSLARGGFTYGDIAAGSHTVTAFNGSTEVATGTVSVSPNEEVIALVYLTVGGGYAVTGFENDTAAPPLGQSRIDIRNSANVGPVDVYINGTEAASGLSNTPTSPSDSVLVTNGGPVTITVVPAGEPTSDFLYSETGDIVAGDLLNIFVVGDSTASPSTLGLLTNAMPLGTGYRLYASDGGVFDYGNASFYGSEGATHLNEPAVGAAQTSIGLGYWLVASDGGVFSFGDANFYGSTGGIRLNKPVVGIAATPDDEGYWLVASDGGVFSYGDAAFYGSLGALHLNQPIVGMAATPDGLGYWLVGADGGVFSFGDASFYGSTGDLTLAKPIVGIVPTVDGHGYWLVASDGGVFAFGDAGFYGSMGGVKLNKPIVAAVSTPDSLGYWLVAADGGIFSFGDAGFYGSAANLKLNGPIVSASDPGAALPT